jgi:DNA-binding XRE family transcriptional regulator
MRDLDKHIEKHSRDKEFKIYFDRAEAKRKIAQEIAGLRKAHHITQAQLAKKIKTSQQVISRLESSHDKRMPSLQAGMTKKNLSTQVKNSHAPALCL